MIAAAFMLVSAAKKAGIKVPPDPENYSIDEYPHWHVYAYMQVGAPMPDSSAHWSNAEVVAAIPNDRIREVTPKQLREEFGFRVGYSK